MLLQVVLASVHIEAESHTSCMQTPQDGSPADGQMPKVRGRRRAHVLGDKETGFGTLKQVVFEKLAAQIKRLDILEE